MIDIVDRIKQVALALGWKFTYGEQDIKNLIEAAVQQTLDPTEIHLMLLPVVRTPTTNDFGRITAIDYDLAFSIFTPDDFDQLVADEGSEYYFQKFDYKVRPMLNAYYYLHRNLICPGLVLAPRRITEIYNDGTENLTGIFIEATCQILVDDSLGEIVPVPPLPPIPTFCQLLADCEVFKSLEERVAALEEKTPADLISDDEGNALQVGDDGKLFVPNSGSSFNCDDLEGCENFQEVKQKANTALQPSALSGYATEAWVALQGYITNVITALGYTPENVANKSTSVTTDQASNTKYPSVKAVYDWVVGLGYQTSAQVTTAIANKFQFFADLANTSVNTNTTNNVIGVVLIPANTVTNNTVLEIESWVSRAVGGANGLHRLFINTSNAFAGATEVARITTTTTSIFSKGERTFVCKTGQMRGFNATTTSALDDITTTVAPTTTSVNWTVDQYFLTVVNNATGETTTHEATTVKVIKP